MLFDCRGEFEFGDNGISAQENHFIVRDARRPGMRIGRAAVPKGRGTATWDVWVRGVVTPRGWVGGGGGGVFCSGGQPPIAKMKSRHTVLICTPSEKFDQGSNNLCFFLTLIG
jgi:hypothetical protein